MVEERKLPRGWQSREAEPTSLFIRDYLIRYSETYPYKIYKELKNVREFKKSKIGSPLTFYKYIHILQKLGLIERVGKTENSSKKGFKRVYYRIVKGKENSPDWVNPQKVWRSRFAKHEETQPSGEEGTSETEE